MMVKNYERCMITRPHLNSTILDLLSKHLTLMMCCITLKDITVCGEEARLVPESLGPKQNNPVCTVVVVSQWTHTALVMFPTRTVVFLLDLVSFVWLYKSSK